MRAYTCQNSRVPLVLRVGGTRKDKQRAGRGQERRTKSIVERTAESSEERGTQRARERERVHREADGRVNVIGKTERERVLEVAG